MTRVVVDGAPLAAFGAAECSSSGVFNKDIDLLRLRVELDVRDKPWLLKSKDLLVEFGFLHRRSPVLQVRPKLRSAPSFCGFRGCF